MSRARAPGHEDWLEILEQMADLWEFGSLSLGAARRAPGGPGTYPQVIHS